MLVKTSPKSMGRLGTKGIQIRQNDRNHIIN